MSGGLLKNLWRIVLLGALASVLLGGSQALATTFTLTHNGWTYYEDISQQGLGDFKDTNGVDHMWRNWWWYRTSNMQRELPLSNLVPGAGIDLIGTNEARLRFVEQGLFFELVYKLTGISNEQAKVDIKWEIKSAGPSLGVDFFAYSDFDLNGVVASPDSGVLVDPKTVRFIKGTTAVDVIASEAGLVGYEVGTYPNLLNKLNDIVLDNVSNSGLPYGPGDMENIFQWRGTVVSGQQTMKGTLTKLINLNYSPPPPGPVIPEPGTWALMLSGLAPVALRLRKKA